jgi:Domain of Unknown Function (DUF1206)
MSVETRRELASAERAVEKPAEKAREKARTGSGWYEWTARSGLVAKGVSYGILGVLALKLALGDGGKATSRSGALHTIVQHQFGKVLVIALAVGFAAYALWRIVQAFAEREEGDGEKGKAKKWGKRAGYLGRAAIYVGLTYTCVKLLTGAGEESQNEKAHQTTATVLDWPAGRWIVAGVGLAIFGVGLWNAYRAFTTKFEDKWRGMGRTVRKVGGGVGFAGHLARAVVFGLVGIFIVKAAIDYNAKEARGLDGALQELAGHSYGEWLLGLTATGLLAYGIFCFFDARYRDVSANAG